MKIKHLLLAMIAMLAVGANAQVNIVRTDGTHFYKGQSEHPYYYIGTNFWYGPILASEGAGGNRERLTYELDSLKSLGVDNLRILAGADAGSKNANSVQPYLQTAPGEYNDTLLAGLDYLLVEMAKRDMVAVIYLTNTWDWSGGYGFYLRATGHGDSPDSHGQGYKEYSKYVHNFFNDDKAQQLLSDHVRSIVSRTNSITGKPYRDDPTIMAWQLCNEPRPFGEDNFAAFERWTRATSALIKSIDPNHLISTGSEGIMGCDFDTELCERIHNDPNIDYLTIHIWPVNWRWASADRLYDALPNVYLKSQEYIEQHERMALKANKPLVIEEFGYSRDHTFYKPQTGTVSRDAFYRFIFSKVRESKADNGPLAGCNFWGWGGAGRPDNEIWHPGSDYVCDPPHEPQGWYCVYDCDESTIQVIRQAWNEQ